MSGLVVYHNPSCNTSRRATSFLEEQRGKVDDKIYELQVCCYQTDPPSRDTLEKLAKYLGLVEMDESSRPWDVLLRPEGKKKAQGWTEAWEMLEQDPSLLERPFVIDWDHQRAALGRIVPGNPDLLTVERLVELYHENQ